MPEPALEDLQDALNMWPPGTRGERVDNGMILAIFTLAKSHGHGRTLQVAKAIHDVWDRPEYLQMYRYQRQKHLEVLERNREIILDDT